MDFLDCRGMACPEPVLATRRALAEIQNEDYPLEVRVDFDALANVCRMLGSGGYSYQTIECGDYYRILVNEKHRSAKAETKPSVWLITSTTLGQGSDELGLALMKSLLHTLSETEPPGIIFFLNSSVKLSAGPDALSQHLQTLVEKKWLLGSCGTCLDYYSLRDQVQAGEITNMYAIVEGIQSAAKVITI